jgi:hypothetical protein
MDNPEVEVQGGKPTKSSHKKILSGYNKSTCTPTFIEALFTIVKLWK